MNRLIWIRIPKTASSSIHQALKERELLRRLRLEQGRITMIPARRNRQFRRRQPEAWASVPKFAVIRNPYDRMISGWHFMWPENRPSLEALLEEPPERSRNYEQWLHFTLCQEHFLTDEEGRLDVQWLVRFENLQEDLNAMLAYYGFPPVRLPHRNASNRRPGYRRYFKGRVRELADRHLKRDLQLLPYQF